MLRLRPPDEPGREISPLDGGIASSTRSSTRSTSRVAAGGVRSEDRPRVLEAIARERLARLPLRRPLRRGLSRRPDPRSPARRPVAAPRPPARLPRRRGEAQGRLPSPRSSRRASARRGASGARARTSCPIRSGSSTSRSAEGASRSGSKARSIASTSAKKAATLLALVLDYKTGSIEGKSKEAKTGRAFQLPLYAFVLPRLLAPHARGRAVRPIAAAYYQVEGAVRDRHQGAARGRGCARDAAQPVEAAARRRLREARRGLRRAGARRRRARSSRAASTRPRSPTGGRTCACDELRLQLVCRGRDEAARIGRMPAATGASRRSVDLVGGRRRGGGRVVTRPPEPRAGPARSTASARSRSRAGAGSGKTRRPDRALPARARGRRLRPRRRARRHVHAEGDGRGAASASATESRRRMRDDAAARRARGGGVRERLGGAWILTIDAFCHRLLAEMGPAAGLPAERRILTGGALAEVLNEAMRQVDRPRRRRRPPIPITRRCDAPRAPGRRTSSSGTSRCSSSGARARCPGRGASSRDRATTRPARGRGRAAPRRASRRAPPTPRSRAARPPGRARADLRAPARALPRAPRAPPAPATSASFSRTSPQAFRERARPAALGAAGSATSSSTSSRTPIRSSGRCSRELFGAGRHRAPRALRRRRREAGDLLVPRRRRRDVPRRRRARSPARAAPSSTLAENYRSTPRLVAFFNRLSEALFCGTAARTSRRATRR